MKKGLQWPIGVVAVLVLTVAGNIYVAVRANDDPSVHIESDYYQKAVRFDAEQALKKRSERLGWRMQLASARVGTGQETISVSLVDSAGAPVRGAVVRLAAHAVARANDVFTGTAVETGDTYVVTLQMARRGLWDVDVEVVRGGDRFIATQRLDLPEAK